MSFRNLIQLKNPTRKAILLCIRQYDCDRTGGGEQGISMGCADTYLYTLGRPKSS